MTRSHPLHSQPLDHQSPARVHQGRGRFRLEALALALACAVLNVGLPGAIGVNEPHWLCKARHWFDPAYCPRDFFLGSYNAHAVFLWCAGWCSRWMSLETLAWGGRAIAGACLAVGAIRLCRAMGGRPGDAAFAVLLFSVLQWIGNFSGEWVFGGFEAKPFAWAALWCGYAELMDRRWNHAAAWGGLAISLHPVVGAWGVLAALLAIAWTPPRRLVGMTDRTTLRAVLSAGAIGGLCALPGLIPAIGLLRSAPSPEISAQANHIQVYLRLRHHLDPTAFLPGAYLWYGVLCAGWLALRRTNRSPEVARFCRVVDMSTLFAVIGIALGWWPNVAGFAGQRVTFPIEALLKFYPFRLADALLPLGLAMLCSTTVSRTVWRRRTEWMVLLGLGSVAVFVPSPLNSREVDRRLDESLRADWNTMCVWIREQTPTDAMFVTPTFGWEFKWRAERAEFFSPKDCPQDAAGIVEWKRRSDVWRDWRKQSFDGGVTQVELANLARLTQAAYLLIHKDVAVLVKPIHTTDKFAVYRLGPSSG
jgi:hypothetical protein